MALSTRALIPFACAVFVSLLPLADAFAQFQRTSSSFVLNASSKTRAVDDAIASMGLTQVKKRTKHKKKKVNHQRKASSSNETAKSKRQQPLPARQVDDETKDISLQVQLDYSREGHAALRNFIPPHIIQEVYQDLKAYSKDARKKGEDSAPFLQFFNTWRDVPSIQRLTRSPLLCHAAACMLNLPPISSSDIKVRLYQDSVFIKRSNDGITPWHIDGRMMPFDTSNAITFWIPLQDIPSIGKGGTGLLFINKSHSDFSLPYWNGRGNDNASSSSSRASSYNAYDHLATRYGITQQVGQDRIADTNPGVIDHHMPLNVGDCTVHNGWTMHCANNNGQKGGAKTRFAIAITYVDSHAQVREDVPKVGKNVRSKSAIKPTRRPLGDAEDSASYADWIGDVAPRTRFEHELVPDVWPPVV